MPIVPPDYYNLAIYCYSCDSNSTVLLDLEAFTRATCTVGENALRCPLCWSRAINYALQLFQQPTYAEVVALHNAK